MSQFPKIKMKILQKLKTGQYLKYHTHKGEHK